MKNPKFPGVGTPGPRRPIPPLTVPLDEAKHLPHGSRARLVCELYCPLPEILPNGLPRSTRLMADALLRIGGDFRAKARILRSEPGLPLRLEIEQAAWDIATDQQVIMPPYSDEIIRAAYDAVASQQMLANARLGGTEGRN